MSTPTPVERPDAAPDGTAALQAQLARLSAQLDEVVAETRRLLTLNTTFTSAGDEGAPH